MGGLSTGYINDKLNAEGTTDKTKQLLLEFLNTAQSAAAIAGTEPIEGPVFDDPAEGYGDQYRDYDIGLTVAQRIIDKRNGLGGFSTLDQLAGISHFGRDKFNDLLHSFSMRVSEISAVNFNFRSGAGEPYGLNIRSNFATAAPSPSWQKGRSTAYADSPVAYPIKETQGRAICLQAAFEANGISAAHVRAIGGGRLGRIKEQLVSFDDKGQSGLQTFELEQTTFHAHGINAYNVLWRWQWRLSPDSPWRELASTHHRVFILLGTPTAPWTQTPEDTTLPWTDALEIACGWAAGATDQDSAAGLITQQYNSCGKVAYDTTAGATFYGWSTFNLTQMIDRLNGGPGLGGLVNATDNANTVSTLANLLGCDLWQARLGWSFKLNKLLPIGHDTWEVPFGWGVSYHEVAWKGACTEDDQLFDGCFQFDDSADPTATPPTPSLPVNMVFSDGSAKSYQRRLCPPGSDGCAKCQAQPSTRRRRPLV